MGQGHHHVAVRDTQQLVFHACSPFERVTPSARGAETVLAAMVDFPDFTTFGAGISIYPQSGGAAYPYGICSLILFRGDILCRMLGVLVPPTVEIVCQAVLFSVPQPSDCADMSSKSIIFPVCNCLLYSLIVTPRP